MLALIASKVEKFYTCSVVGDITRYGNSDAVKSFDLSLKLLERPNP